MTVDNRLVRFVTVGLLVAVASTASAVCLDPRDPTLTKYYHPSLEEEIAAAQAIVVGEVIAAEPLAEDASDPAGWTAFRYTVRVRRQLGGVVPASITIKAENDSGGYRMNAGETHLLFLKKNDASYSVDPCGNSTALPQGAAVVERVEQLLSKRSISP